jgi:hypothetical protein
MSLALIKSQIDRFLVSDTPEVMAIKGTWGVGKTFAWNKYITEASRSNRIALDHYSYVSLFGLNSLDELKLSMFVEMIHRKHIGTEPDKTSIATADKKLSSLSRRAIELFRGLPYAKDLWSSIQSMSFYSLRNTIVCIDDFERKGKNLDAQDVMGLVSFLKENRKCKIVLILNDQSLANHSLIDYKKYREKVIDIELLFNPSAPECLSIALSNEDANSRKLKGFIELLGINNIRIIKKIEALSALITPLLSGFEEEVSHQALQSLTLFAWCFYNTPGSVPDYEFVKNFEYGLLGLGDQKKDETEDEKRWKVTLRRYGYLNTDEFDLQLASLVEQGYVNEDQFAAEARKLNEQRVALKSRESYEKAWEAYHDTFANNEEELVSRILDSFRKNLKYISPMNLDGTVTLFRELGRDAVADEVIETYVSARQTEIGLFSLDNNPFRHRIRDEKLLQRFDAECQTRKVIRSLRDVLTKIAGKDGWGGDDEEILSTATVEEYYNLFKGEMGPHLSSWVDTCLQFGRFSNASERMLKISENATAALRMIGKESRLNALRVRKYGVELKPEGSGEQNA